MAKKLIYADSTGSVGVFFNVRTGNSTGYSCHAEVQSDGGVVLNSTSTLSSGTYIWQCGSVAYVTNS